MNSNFEGKHRGTLLLVKGQETNRAHCTKHDGHAWGPCPFHEPDVYSRYAARHRDGLLVSSRRIPEQRRTGGSDG